MVNAEPLETIEDGLQRLIALCTTHPNRNNIYRMQNELAALRLVSVEKKDE